MGNQDRYIHQDISKTYASFEYDENFVNSRIELSPLRMSLGKNIYEFPALAGEPFYGMPGLLADSLPDRFGNAVIEQWIMSLGKSLSDFTASDSLAYLQLVQVGCSAGGARAKALIAWNEDTNEVRSGQMQLGIGYGLWRIKSSWAVISGFLI